MASINDVKEALNKEELNTLKGVISPYKALVDYFSSLEESINSLEESKPIGEKQPRRRRSTIKKEKVESENV